MTKLHNLVYCVCIAEFDILKGNTLSYIYPPERDVQTDYSIPDEAVPNAMNLADMCLPDGAHVYEEDMTYMFLPAKPRMKHILEMTDGQNTIYGLVLFRNKRDSTVKRGAIQKSIVLLASQPYFTIWETMLRNTINRVLNNVEEPKKALEELYNALCNEKIQQNLQVELWNEKYPIKVPILPPDHFAGASLIQLVKLFKRDTMLLWYGLLVSSRVIFVGTPARAVANCTLAAPLLVQPLIGYTPLITPYVALTDLNAVMRPAYICGTTNNLFEVRQEWWDICASFRTGSVLVSRTHKQLAQIKLTAADKEHILNVMGGIEDGKSEQWVREQFKSYTTKYLQRFVNDNATGVPGAIRKTTHYSLYQTKLLSGSSDNEQSSEKSALELINSLIGGSNDSTAKSTLVLDRNKCIFQLSQAMSEDLNTVDTILSKYSNFVEIVSGWLTDENSQFRKYAAKVLSCIAGIIKGQLAILNDGHVLQRIILLLDDDMPNVRTESAYCVMKISSLFVGVQALLKYQHPTHFQQETDPVTVHIPHYIIRKLYSVMSKTTSDVKIKMYAVMALMNIYKFAPETEKPESAQVFLHEAKSSPDKRYVSSLLQLLDLWQEHIQFVIVVSHEARKMCQQIARHESTDFAVQVCEALCVEFAQDPTFILECIECDVVRILYNNLKRSRENVNVQNKSYLYDIKLAELSVRLLTIIADTHSGMGHILRWDVIDECLSVIIDAKHDRLTMSVLSLIEALMGVAVTREVFVSRIYDVLPIFVSFIEKYYHKSLAANMTLPAIKILTRLLRNLPYPDIHQLITTENINEEDPIDSNFDDITYNPMWTTGAREELTQRLDALQSLDQAGVSKKVFDKKRVDDFTDEIKQAGVGALLQENLGICLSIANRRILPD